MFAAEKVSLSKPQSCVVSMVCHLLPGFSSIHLLPAMVDSSWTWACFIQWYMYLWFTKIHFYLKLSCSHMSVFINHELVSVSSHASLLATWVVLNLLVKMAILQLMYELSRLKGPDKLKPNLCRVVSWKQQREGNSKLKWCGQQHDSLDVKQCKAIVY